MDKNNNARFNDIKHHIVRDNVIKESIAVFPIETEKMADIFPKYFVMKHEDIGLIYCEGVKYYNRPYKICYHLPELEHSLSFLLRQSNIAIFPYTYFEFPIHICMYMNTFGCKLRY